jgi:hypothetical protein
MFIERRLLGLERDTFAFDGFEKMVIVQELTPHTCLRLTGNLGRLGIECAKVPLICEARASPP